MGSGKSFLGKRLAQLMNYQFIDLDDWIEEKSGKTIKELFETEGEAAFRAMETKALEAMASINQVVIACGGGTPCFNNNMNRINDIGISIYLKAPTPLLYERLIKGIAHRPLLRGKDEQTLKAFIDQKVNERDVFYKQATLIFKQNLHQTDGVTDLFKLIGNYSKKQDN